jgi:hypothetical protein
MSPPLVLFLSCILIFSWSRAVTRRIPKTGPNDTRLWGTSVTHWSLRTSAYIYIYTCMNGTVAVALFFATSACILPPESVLDALVVHLVMRRTQHNTWTWQQISLSLAFSYSPLHYSSVLVSSFLLNAAFVNTLWNEEFSSGISEVSRSQWPRVLRHEVSPPAQTLVSWVRIPLEACMSVCVYSVFVLSCACR